MISLPKDTVEHPGEMIKELMKDYNISMLELCNKTRLGIEYVSSVIVGMDNINNEFAKGLEDVFGISKDFWLKIQNDYNKFIG